MATNKPRLTVTLEPRVYELISRMAKCTGQSRSALISELLQQVEEPLRGTVALLEAAAAAPAEVRRKLKAQAERVERDLGASYEANLAQMDFLRGALDASGDSGAGATEAPPLRGRKRKKSA